MTDDGSAMVYLGITPSAGRPEDRAVQSFYLHWRPSTIVRHRISSGALSSLFAGVVEPLNGGKSSIQSIDRLPLASPSLDAIALRITFTNGRVDTYLVDLNNPRAAGVTQKPSTVVTADGQYRLNGRVGVHIQQKTGSLAWSMAVRDFQHPGGVFSPSNQVYQGTIDSISRKVDNAENDAFITSTPLPLGKTLQGRNLSLTFGALAGTGTEGISQMFAIDHVEQKGDQYYIVLTDDPQLMMSDGSTVEQMAPLRTFTGPNQFEIALSAVDSGVSPTCGVK